MKWNWGTGILIVIIIFFIAIFSMIFFFSSQQINLVEEDYYPKELDFDTQMEKISNTNALDEKITMQINPEFIALRFPDIVTGENPAGTIQIYRPSDFERDLYLEIDLDSLNMQLIGTKGLLSGKYILKIDWSLNDVNYYQEEVFINR